MLTASADGFGNPVYRWLLILRHLRPNRGLRITSGLGNTRRAAKDDEPYYSLFENVLMQSVAVIDELQPGKPVATSKRPTETKPDIKLSAEAKLAGVLVLYAKDNTLKKPSIAFLAKEAGVSRKTATKCPSFRALYDKMYSELQK